MNELAMALGTAIWLGILTSISPCPAATNIAAISFIGRKFHSHTMMFLTGLLYSFGRSFLYIVLSIIIVSSLLSVPAVSNWLTKYINQILGPILIIIGMVLLEMMKIPIASGFLTGWTNKQAEKFGLAGAFLLGVVFAMSFCPISAGIYFGSVIPLSIKYSSKILIPLVYGIGTALPVLAASIVIAFAANRVGVFFEKMKIFELWARRITGGLFILIGIFLTLKYTLTIF